MHQVLVIPKRAMPEFSRRQEHANSANKKTGRARIFVAPDRCRWIREQCPRRQFSTQAKERATLGHWHLVEPLRRLRTDDQVLIPSHHEMTACPPNANVECAHLIEGCFSLHRDVR